MKTYQAKRIAIEHKHVRINGESCISTERVDTAQVCQMIVPFHKAKKARRVMIMRGAVDMQMIDHAKFVIEMRRDRLLASAVPVRA
jgi:hypothetical protein